MKRFLVLALMWASAAFGQVFTTLYLPTAGSGLTLNIAAGRAFCGGSVVTYAGGTLTMAASLTNRVYLNTASSCAPAVKSSAFVTGDIPIAMVVTSGSAITSVTDARTMFNQMLTSSQVVSSINGSPGSFTFSGSGVSCVGTTCTFTGGGSSGVQYNPTTTSYIIPSTSSMYNDGDSISTALPAVTSIATSGTSIDVQFASTHGLNLGGAVDLSNLTGWPNGVYQAAQVGSFQVTAVVSTTEVTLSNPLSYSYSCSSSCGTAYDASYWAIWQFARQPFIYGHGTVFGIETTTQNLATNFATLTAGMGGTPTYLGDMTGVNDIAAGRTPAQIVTDHLTVYAAAHTAGMKVMQSTLVPASYGVTGHDTQQAQVNMLLWAKRKIPSNAASGQYWDYWADPATALIIDGPANPALPDPNSAAILAASWNLVFASQSSVAAFPPDHFTYSVSTLGGNGVPAEVSQAQKQFYDGNWNEWMVWDQGAGNSKGIDLYASNYYRNSVVRMWNAFMTAGQSWISDTTGRDSGNNNGFNRYFTYAGANSTSNYLSWAPFGGSDVVRLYADREFVLPAITTTPNTAPVCFNGALGGLTNVDCASGGLGDPGSNGVVKRTALNTTTTATFSDIVLMWASGACSSGYLKFDGSCDTPSGTFTAGGDLSGSSTNQTVEGLKTVAFCTGFTPVAGDIVVYTTGGTPNPCYAAQAAPSGSFTAGGDLSGSSTSQQVIGINGVPLCTGFSPTNGQNLQYTTGGTPNPCYTAATGGGGPTYLYMIDDFTMANTTPFGLFRWIQGSAGTGNATTIATGNTYPGHNGVILLNSGTSVNGWTSIYVGNSGNGAGPYDFDIGLGPQSMTAEVLVPDVTAQISAVGFTYRPTSGTGSVRENGFRCDPTLGTNDWYTYINTGAVTTADTGVSCSNVWHQLEVLINGTTVTFYIDGVSVGTGTAGTTTGFVPWVLTQSPSGTTPKYIAVDWVALSTLATYATIH